ncbi:hypothetical protein ACUYOF_23265 [Photobacterium ganghwense]|uniref:hypothetical protein n=1 Tax=Photobacterium ganghwense TaxID=320778 RepID=UPI004055FBB0
MMKYGIAAILMCMSPIVLAVPQYQIDVKVENNLQVLNFSPFQVSEGRWGGAETGICAYRGRITQQDSGLLLESKMDCSDAGWSSHYEMPVFVVESGGGDVSIVYEDGDDFWKYSAKIHPVE